MRTLTTLSCSLLLACGAMPGLALAADGTSAGRFGFVNLERDFDVTVDSGSTVNNKVDSARSFRLTYHWDARNDVRKMAYGMDVGLSYSTIEDNSSDLTIVGLVFEPGLAVTVNDSFVLECFVPLGLGYADLDLGGSNPSMDGFSYDYGLGLRPVWQATRQFGVYGEATYMVRHIEVSGNSQDVEYESNGLTIGFGVSVSF